MILTEKETTTMRDLQTQEQMCIKKYEKYGEQAHDTELKSLFERLRKEEQKELRRQWMEENQENFERWLHQRKKKEEDDETRD